MQKVVHIDEDVTIMKDDLKELLAEVKLLRNDVSRLRARVNEIDYHNRLSSINETNGAEGTVRSHTNTEKTSNVTDDVGIATRKESRFAVVPFKFSKPAEVLDSHIRLLKYVFDESADSRYLDCTISLVCHSHLAYIFAYCIDFLYPLYCKRSETIVQTKLNSLTRHQIMSLRPNKPLTGDVSIISITRIDTTNFSI